MTDNNEARRHHYIPRFLLARFAAKIAGKRKPNPLVWQMSRTDTRFASVKRVAFAMDFYGQPGNRIEKPFSIRERAFARALHVIDRDGDLDTHQDVLKEFLWTMAIRGRSLREQFTTTGVMILEEVLRHFREPTTQYSLAQRAIEELHGLLDSDELPQQLAAQARERLAAVDPDQLRSYLQRYTEGLMTHIAKDESMSMLASRVAESATSGQRRSLERILSVDSFTAPPRLAASSLELLTCHEPEFVLGDACAVAVAQDGATGSVLERQDWSFLCIPISPCQLLVARSADASGLLGGPVSDFNAASCSIATKYVYASNEAHAPPAMRKLIGTRPLAIARDRISEIVANPNRSDPGDPVAESSPEETLSADLGSAP